MSLRTTIRPVTPYRLDLTAQALRRVNTNVVDVVAPDGKYLRAFSSEEGVNIVEVHQVHDDLLEVHITGHHARRLVETISRMLGTSIDLTVWNSRVAMFPWLADLARDVQGVKPPRYPDLWEASCNAIVFQQLSIFAAAAIMRRFVERFSDPIEHEGLRLYAFPEPVKILHAGEFEFQGVGLSRQKVLYLKDVAAAVISRSITSTKIESLSTDAALHELQKVRGIGRWAAANILLRGYGRLDVFPPSDSGAIQSIKILSSDPKTSLEDVLSSLGNVRGMLYFHFLLGRLRRLDGL